MRVRHYNVCTTSTTIMFTISYKLIYTNVGAVLEYDSVYVIENYFFLIISQVIISK